MHISVMFRRVVSFIASLFMDMCAAENPFERMRHSANVSYFQQFTFFSFLGVCVCVFVLPFRRRCCCCLFVFLLRIFLSLEERALLFCVSSSFVVFFYILCFLHRCRCCFFSYKITFAVALRSWSHSLLCAQNELVVCLFFPSLSLSLPLCILPYSLALLLIYFSSENDTTGAIVRNIIMQFY